MRKTLCLLLLTAALFAQRSDTVFQQVIADSVSISAIRNIGQAQHLLLIKAKDKPPNTCTLANAFGTSVQLAGSFNGVNYVGFGAYVTIPSGSYTGIGYANGPFPFLRPVIVTSHVANCLVDAWYSGTLPSVSLPGAFNAAGTGYGNSSVTVSGIGENAFTNLVAGATQRVVIYGLVINVVDAQSVSIVTKATSGGGITAFVLTLSLLAAGQTVVVPVSAVPFFIGVPGDDVYIQLTAAVACNITAIYRIEPL